MEMNSTLDDEDRLFCDKAKRTTKELSVITILEEMWQTNEEEGANTEGSHHHSTNCPENKVETHGRTVDVKGPKTSGELLSDTSRIPKVVAASVNLQNAKLKRHRKYTYQQIDERVPRFVYARPKPKAHQSMSLPLPGRHGQTCMGFYDLEGIGLSQAAWLRQCETRIKSMPILDKTLIPRRTLSNTESQGSRETVSMTQNPSTESKRLLTDSRDAQQQLHTTSAGNWQGAGKPRMTSISKRAESTETNALQRHTNTPSSPLTPALAKPSFEFRKLGTSVDHITTRNRAMPPPQPPLLKHSFSMPDSTRNKHPPLVQQLRQPELAVEQTLIAHGLSESQEAEASWEPQVSFNKKGLVSNTEQPFDQPTTGSVQPASATELPETRGSVTQSEARVNVYFQATSNKVGGRMRQIVQLFEEMARAEQAECEPLLKRLQTLLAGTIGKNTGAAQPQGTKGTGTETAVAMVMGGENLGGGHAALENPLEHVQQAQRHMDQDPVYERHQRRQLSKEQSNKQKHSPDTQKVEQEGQEIRYVTRALNQMQCSQPTTTPRRDVNASAETRKQKVQAQAQEPPHGHQSGSNVAEEQPIYITVATRGERQDGPMGNEWPVCEEKTGDYRRKRQRIAAQNCEDREALEQAFDHLTPSKGAENFNPQPGYPYSSVGAETVSSQSRGCERYHRQVCDSTKTCEEDLDRMQGGEQRQKPYSASTVSQQLCVHRRTSDTCDGRHSVYGICDANADVAQTLGKTGGPCGGAWHMPEHANGGYEQNGDKHKQGPGMDKDEYVHKQTQHTTTHDGSDIGPDKHKHTGACVHDVPVTRADVHHGRYNQAHPVDPCARDTQKQARPGHAPFVRSYTPLYRDLAIRASRTDTINTQRGSGDSRELKERLHDRTSVRQSRRLRTFLCKATIPSNSDCDCTDTNAMQQIGTTRKDMVSLVFRKVYNMGLEEVIASVEESRSPVLQSATEVLSQGLTRGANVTPIESERCCVPVLMAGDESSGRFSGLGLPVTSTKDMVNPQPAESTSPSEPWKVSVSAHTDANAKPTRRTKSHTHWVLADKKEAHREAVKRTRRAIDEAMRDLSRMLMSTDHLFTRKEKRGAKVNKLTIKHNSIVELATERIFLLRGKLRATGKELLDLKSGGLDLAEAARADTPPQPTDYQ
ncbi:hypothetical protein SARC_04786 [Sphaeroforma arctica JP610]|uniref:Uncharacterized protein n=1 Tax=Sphaeroforma arctica JP610 TaxID=667725 RepID=A0A0L0G275_9EUKA|nr:hypothetical protein SARC_04786 [Sphaeroforma arctica JP610]KNC82939.1 hypothetical protein SARC_04786 [Sphaeroforma arctica JP610]|eukprot:XP_014156841.1 hypothetical protein SARC_04786 [Sphaeroforma arctica JP610]